MGDTKVVVVVVVGLGAETAEVVGNKNDGTLTQADGNP